MTKKPAPPLITTPRLERREKNGKQEPAKKSTPKSATSSQRELDQLGWGMAALNTGEEVAFGEEAPGVANGVNMNMNGGDIPGHWEAANAATMEAWQSQER